MVKFDKRGIYLFLILFIINLLLDYVISPIFKTLINMFIIIIVISILAYYLFCWAYYRKGVSFTHDDIVNISITAALLSVIIGVIKTIPILTKLPAHLAVFGFFAFLIFVASAVAILLAFIINYFVLKIMDKILISKNGTIYMIIVIIILLVLAGLSITTTSLIPLNTYSDRGVEFKYPASWEIKEYNQNFTMFSVPDESTTGLVLFIADLQNKSDTLEDYNERAIHKIEEKNRVIIRSVGAEFADNPAHKVIHIHDIKTPLGTTTLKTLDIWTTKNGKIYRLMYSAELAYYKKHLNEVKEVIDSFEIKEE